MDLNILKKKQKTLVIADDCIGIWGIVVERSSVAAGNHFAEGTTLKQILEFGKTQNCRSVLYLQTSDIRELDVKLGSDLNDEERLSAIEYAAASELGDHSGGKRISYMDGMFHDFRSGILVSYFDTEEILAMDQLAKSMKMRFLGVTNFKQLLFSLHFSDQDRHGEAFLFLLGSHGVAALPERNKLFIRNLPFGMPLSDPDDEWKERAARRLNSLLRNKRVCLYAPECSGKLSAVLQEICEAQSVEVVDWEETVSRASSFFLEHINQLIHPALPPPKEKDPKASGTWIGFFFFVMTLLSLGFLIGRNCITKYIFERDIREKQSVIDTVKKERTALKDLEKSLAMEQELFSVMKQKGRLSKNYLIVLNLLSRYELQYSRISSIKEMNNGIYIEGESIWQVDLSRFFTHFEGELSKYKLTLFSDGLSKEKDGKILFRSHIAEDGGKR